MRDPKRIDRILNLLREYWTQRPDFRLGQLLCNLSATFESNPFFTEDNLIEQCLINAIKREEIPPSNWPDY